MSRESNKRLAKQTLWFVFYSSLGILLFIVCFVSFGKRGRKVHEAKEHYVSLPTQNLDFRQTEIDLLKEQVDALRMQVKTLRKVDNKQRSLPKEHPKLKKLKERERIKALIQEQMAKKRDVVPQRSTPLSSPILKKQDTKTLPSSAQPAHSVPFSVSSTHIPKRVEQTPSSAPSIPVSPPPYVELASSYLRDQKGQKVVQHIKDVIPVGTVARVFA